MKRAPGRTLHASRLRLPGGCGRRPHELTETIMRRVLVIAASSIALGACSNMSLPSFEMPSMSPTPSASTVEFVSEPAGLTSRRRRARLAGHLCALSVAASDFTTTFTLNGYQPQTVPVKQVQSQDDRGGLTVKFRSRELCQIRSMPS
jgi:hypothetical protein